MDSNWVLVIITAVYVVATICICVANFKSASASKKQLAEMKKQYEETDRPNIEAEFLYIDRCIFGIRFVNHGKHTAQNVKIKIDAEFIDSIDSLGVSDYIRMQKDKKCVIGVDQHYDLLFGSYERYKDLENKTPAIGTVSYDYNNQTYINDFCFDFENYMTIFSAGSKNDDLIDVLTSISSQLDTLNTHNFSKPLR